MLSEPCCESITVGDGEVVHRLGPLPCRAAPVGGDVLQREPDQLRRRVVAREVAAGLDDLAQSRIDSFDRIGRVDHAPHGRRKGEERPCRSPRPAIRNRR